MSSKQEIILRKDGDIGILEINNPPQNYLEQPDFIDAGTLLNFVDSGIKALVITGVGRNFSAGANLESINEQIKNIKQFQDQLIKGNQLLNIIDKLEIPVIAAISGVCFGAGLEIALACDIRCCNEKALFAFPEVNHELMPGLGGAKRMADLAGKSVTAELLLEGDMINAGKAFELSIIDEVVKKNQILEFSVLKAKSLTDGRPLKVINAIMKSIHNAEIIPTEEVITEDAKLFTKLAIDAFGNTEQ